MKFFLKITIIGVVILMMATVAGCIPANSGKSVVTNIQEISTINFKLVDTIGNHTYIPLNMDGNPSDNENLILKVLDAFEKAHPELKVTSWSPQGREAGYNCQPYTFGLWVNHEPND